MSLHHLLHIEHAIEIILEQTYDALAPEAMEGLYAQVVQQHCERALLRYVMRRVAGNQVHAARVLGVNRNTLRSYLKTLGLEAPRKIPAAAIDATKQAKRNWMRGAPMVDA